MAVQTLLSQHNHMPWATIPMSAPNFVGEPFQAGWPASNMKYPHQPFNPAKTVDTQASGGGLSYRRTSMDFGAITSFYFFLFVDVNCTRIELLGSNDGTFSTWHWSSGEIPVQYNYWSRRYVWVHVPPSVVMTRYLVAAFHGATLDGQPYYRIGGLWAGLLYPLPRDLRWDERPRIIEPHRDVPLIGGGTHRVLTGRPYVELTARRLAKTSLATPAHNDELEAWLALDNVIGGSKTTAWFLNRGNNAEGFIMRKMNESNWNVNQFWSEDDLILHEAVGP